MSTQANKEKLDLLIALRRTALFFAVLLPGAVAACAQATPCSR